MLGPALEIAAFLCLAAAAALLVTLLAVVRNGRPRRPRHASAIVIFGARAELDGCSPELEARVAHAARLYARGLAPWVMCSGGISRGVSEPAVMRRCLIDKGVPREAILVDERGSSTRETIRAAAAHERLDWIFVSSPFHVHRILCEARRRDVCGVASPVPITPISAHRRLRWRYCLREVLACWSYALTASRGASQAAEPAPADGALLSAAGSPE